MLNSNFKAPWKPKAGLFEVENTYLSYMNGPCWLKCYSYLTKTMLIKMDYLQCLITKYEVQCRQSLRDISRMIIQGNGEIWFLSPTFSFLRFLLLTNWRTISWFPDSLMNTHYSSKTMSTFVWDSSAEIHME